jgi:acetyl-CoA acetyltransferase
MTKFARYEDKESYDLGREAIIKALDDADMEWKNIQAAFCGSVYQGTASGHKAVSQIGLTGIPIVNIENACSSSGSAFRLAYQSIAAGFYDICLVVGFEKSSRGFIPSSAWQEWERYMGFNVQPANYALGVALYMERYAITLEQFAKVTVKNRKNAVLNPYAKFQQEVTVEEVLTSRMISTPLRLLN